MPNVIKTNFPKAADRIEYNNAIALGRITANLQLSIRYIPVGAQMALYEHYIHPDPEHVKQIFLDACRTFKFNGREIEKIALLEGGIWNGHGVVFGSQVGQECNRAYSSRTESDEFYLKHLYVAPPTPKPDTIEVPLISREEIMSHVTPSPVEINERGELLNHQGNA